MLGVVPAGTGTARAAGNPQASTGETELQEVVVTARRRTESLQDTPVAVTVFSGDQLAQMQVTATTDLDKVVPNLQFHSYGTLTGNNSAAQVFIRGIGQTDATAAVDPGVGLYIDDVYMGRSVGGAMEMRDIANTQVLRGPQGTLFGRNTIGGAVLLTTNGPGEGAGDTVRMSLGQDNLIDGFGAFDVLDGEKWSARISGGFRKRDGYVTRVSDGKDLGNENSLNGQVAVRYKPNSDLTFTLRYDGSREKENGSPFVFQSINPAALFVGVASINAGCPDILDGLPPPTLVGPLADPRCGNDSQYLGPYTNGGTAPVFSSVHNHGGSLVAQWNVNDRITLKSITADRHLRWAGARDADNTPLLILHTNYHSSSKQFSQELQALYTSDRLDGVVGLYYFDENSFDRLLVPSPIPEPHTTPSVSGWATSPRRRSPSGPTSSPTSSAPRRASATPARRNRCTPSCSTCRRPRPPNRPRCRRRSVRTPGRRRPRPAACSSPPTRSGASSPTPPVRAACSTAGTTR